VALVAKRRCAFAALAASGALFGFAVSGSAGSMQASAIACSIPKAGPAYARGVRRALLAKHDLRGERLLAAPNGPTYEGARRYLAPLLYAKGRGGRPLTSSGVYYLPFSLPFSVYARAEALHVADGSEIISGRVGGPSLTVSVGSGGRERYGSCLPRLTPARLADGYLPILQTSYADSAGVQYRQESFVGRVYGTTSPVSFVHLTVDARSSQTGAVVRLIPSARGLSPNGDRLVSGKVTRLLFSAGGTFDGVAVSYSVAAGGLVDVYTGWLNRPTPTRALAADGRTYAAARSIVVGFWQSRLARRAEYIVPEKRVLDAELGVLVQQIALAWRYSAGNHYEELSFAEALDAAEVMAGYGYDDVAKGILRVTLRALPGRFTNWRAGEQLVASALYYRLYRDRSLVEEETPALARFVRVFARQLGHGPHGGLLRRERYSTDIGRQVYGLHGQAVVREGLFAISRVWAQTGHPQLAARSRALAVRLGASLRRAVRRSMKRLPDGSLFVPVALLDKRAPFDRLTASREGSYWNLVMPYALASGFFAPHSAQADGVLRYLLGHGSRLLGVVRAKAEALYGKQAYPVSGMDQVYGLNASRFLADNGRPDQLVLSLYGTLATAMTPDTYISGESGTVAPLGNAYYRSMYLPPNLGGNATFLETLRLMLVHETRGPAGAPRGLELAFSTPRAWLSDGKTITVRNVPTSFGPVSFSIERHGTLVHVAVDSPASPAPLSLRLRLRLPAGLRIAAARLDGLPVRYDMKTGTIDLSGWAGQLELEVALRARA
jgi:hypothetical protein